MKNWQLGVYSPSGKRCAVSPRMNKYLLQEMLKKQGWKMGKHGWWRKGYWTAVICPPSFNPPLYDSNGMDYIGL